MLALAPMACTNQEGYSLALEYLLLTCQFYLGSPLPGVGAKLLLCV